MLRALLACDRHRWEDTLVLTALIHDDRKHAHNYAK